MIGARGYIRYALLTLVVRDRCMLFDLSNLSGGIILLFLLPQSESLRKRPQDIALLKPGHAND
jgi:hypothetical protein